jgi:ABC-type nitrate/sulfonate/bicarbonate transport system permease component
VGTKTDDLAAGQPAPETAALSRPAAEDLGRATSSGLRDALRKKWVLRLIVYGGFLLAWQITAMVQGRFFLPTIPATIAAIGVIFAEGYYKDLFATLQQLVVGFTIALAVAIPLGVLMGRFRIMEDLFSPWVNTLFVTSKESLLPILIIAFGVAFWYRTWVVILFAVFFPIINTAAGVRYVDRELRETARAFQTPPRRMVTHVYLPAAAPFVVAGVRLGFGMAMKGMVIAELWVLQGTGDLLATFARAPRRLDLYYALVVIIITFAVTVTELLKAAERKLRPAAQIVGLA